MKLIFSFLFPTFFTLLLFSQEPIQYESVINVDSVSKEDLFKRGEYFLVSVFKNPQKVIVLSDTEKGQLICKGAFPYMQSKKIWGGWENTKGTIDFKLSIYFKEGRYKYVIEDFIHNANGDYSFGIITNELEWSGKRKLNSKKWNSWIWNDLKKQTQTNSANLLTALKASMIKPLETEKDDW